MTLMKQFCFRVDASETIESRHTMRCFTLANALRDQGASVVFICVAQPGNLIEYLREAGFNVFSISEENPGPETRLELDYN